MAQTREQVGKVMTMAREKEEQLNGEIGNTLVTGKNEELIEISEIKGTPFTLVRHEQNWFVTLGKYRLTPNYDKAEDATAEVYNLEWNFMLSVMQMMVEEGTKELKDMQTQTDIDIANLFKQGTK